MVSGGIFLFLSEAGAGAGAEGREGFERMEIVSPIKTELRCVLSG